jgi:hypothetical protein
MSTTITSPGPVILAGSRLPAQVVPRALLEHLRPLCQSAVDPLEIAAALESEGINDVAAAQLYGYPTVFRLAEALWQNIRRAPTAAPPATNPWTSPASLHLLRGAIFALPGLGYAAAARSLHGATAVVLVIALLIIGWGVGQGISYLGYLRLGGGDESSAARLLTAAVALSGLLLGPLAFVVAHLQGLGGEQIAFLVAEALYLPAAVVPLVLRGERWLFAALIPGALAGAFFLVSGYPAWGWVPFVMSVVLVVLVAAVILWRGVRTGAGRLWLTGRELRAATPHISFGFVAGGLLAFPTLAALLTLSRVDTGGLSPTAAAAATLPLTLSMGAAELALFRFRSYAWERLQEITSTREFARRARRGLLAAFVAYTAVLVALTAAFELISPLAAVAPLAAYLAIGGALFAALVLQSCGEVTAALGWCAVALALQIGDLGAAALLDVRLPLYAMVCGMGVVLAGVVGASAIRSVGMVTRHR